MYNRYGKCGVKGEGRTGRGCIVLITIPTTPDDGETARGEMWHGSETWTTRTNSRKKSDASAGSEFREKNPEISGSSPFTLGAREIPRVSSSSSCPMFPYARLSQI